MKYNTKYSERYKSFQIWKIGYPIDGVWFNISSAKADGKYLTVTKIGNLKELTMEKGGTVCIANYMLYQLLLQCISWQSGHTARSIEIVLRGGPLIFRLMLMDSRGGPLFWGCMLMNSRGRPPFGG